MTTTDASGRSSTARDECFGALADARRRAVVRIVADRSPSGITKAALASQLAADIADSEPAVVTEDEQRRAHSACQHRLLPPLIDAGLLEVQTDGLIRTTDHWAYDADGLESVLDGRSTASSDELDAVFESLSDSRRRRALATLKHQYQPTTVDELAGAITTDATDRGHPADTIDRTRTSLVHADLPLLRDAGLVAYDSDAGRVSYDGHPILRADWLGDTRSSEHEYERTPTATTRG